VPVPAVAFPKTLRGAPNASQMAGRRPMLEREATELNIPSHEARFIGPMPATTRRKLTMPVRLSRHPRVPRAGPTHGDGKFHHSLRRPTERRVLDMIERGSWAGLLPSGT
jgi:hypothetical protein